MFSRSGGTVNILSTQRAQTIYSLPIIQHFKLFNKSPINVNTGTFATANGIALRCVSVNFKSCSLTLPESVKKSLKR